MSARTAVALKVAERGRLSAILVLRSLPLSLLLLRPHPSFLSLPPLDEDEDGCLCDLCDLWGFLCVDKPAAWSLRWPMCVCVCGMFEILKNTILYLLQFPFHLKPMRRLCLFLYSLAFHLTEAFPPNTKFCSSQWILVIKENITVFILIVQFLRFWGYS